MKLLIITQVVDKNHSILGFFHRWIEEFAKQCEQVTVVCLEAGKHSLPANVTVFSLGKESGQSKLSQLLNFYRYIWRERRQYDQVFVHMNPLYVVLGGLLWRLWGKQIGLWYTHGTVSFSLRIATLLTHKVFTASEESFRIKTKKKIVTGHGIDTERFKPVDLPKDTDLITIGRLSPVKNIETLLDVLAGLRRTFPVTLIIVGSALDEKGKEYVEQLKAKSRELGMAEAVIFHDAVSQADLPALLNRAKVFVTASKTGSLDKVVLEAMACGLPVVSSAEGTKSLKSGVSQVETPVEWLANLNELLNTGNQKLVESVLYIKTEHSLKQLIISIKKIYTD